MLSAVPSSGKVNTMIRIAGIGDHDRPEGADQDQRNAQLGRLHIVPRRHRLTAAAVSRLDGWKASDKVASAAIFSSKGPWRLSLSGALHRAFTNRRFKDLGLFSMRTLAGA
jgi:hypothetical protein